MQNDILSLFECLKLSESTACSQKSRSDRILALCMLLKERFSYPYRCEDMVLLFGWNPTELHLIFALDFIYQCHRHHLD